MIASAFLFATDLAIAAAIGTKVRNGGGVLAAPVTLGAIAGLMALGTTFYDIIELKELMRKQKSKTKIVEMQPSEANESN
ncbi:hypothetical protein MMC31_004722 [Peltigera leucophlebia]|nr:hypothetical protein [Peltigera leucophlebia]